MLYHMVMDAVTRTIIIILNNMIMITAMCEAMTIAMITRNAITLSTNFRMTGTTITKIHMTMTSSIFPSMVKITSINAKYDKIKA